MIPIPPNGSNENTTVEEHTTAATTAHEQQQQQQVRSPSSSNNLSPPLSSGEFSVNSNNLVDPFPKKLRDTVNARLKSDAILCVVIAVAVTLLHWSGFFAKLQVLMNKMFIRVLRFSQILSIRFPHKEYRLLILNLQLFFQNCEYSFTTTSSKIWVSRLVS